MRALDSDMGARTHFFIWLTIHLALSLIASQNIFLLLLNKLLLKVSFIEFDSFWQLFDWGFQFLACHQRLIVTMELLLKDLSVKNTEIQIQLGPRAGLRQSTVEILGGKMDPFPVQLLFSSAPVLFEPSCSPLAVSWIPKEFEWPNFEFSQQTPIFSKMLES